jgi:hypothetical protein
MCKLRIGPVLIILILALSACASSPSYSPSSEDPDLTIPAGTDSSVQADYEDLFVEIHSRLLDELGKEDKNDSSPAMIEIWTIVKIAEDAYLRGTPLLAIKLLTEAELLLRQNP